MLRVASVASKKLQRRISCSFAHSGCSQSQSPHIRRVSPVFSFCIPKSVSFRQQNETATFSVQKQLSEKSQLSLNRYETQRKIKALYIDSPPSKINKQNLINLDFFLKVLLTENTEANAGFFSGSGMKGSATNWRNSADCTDESAPVPRNLSKRATASSGFTLCVCMWMYKVIF